MLNFDKALDLPPQLQWKYANEPELMTWSIRARNYNTFVANLMFSFMATVILGATLIMYSVYEGMSQSWRISSCIFFFSLMLLVLLSVTHQRMNFVYRFTQSGVEYCKWKDFPKWALTFLKWFTGITAVIFIFLATLDSTFLIGALIGPGGMGLMYLSMANSKSFQEMHTEYHHHTFKWEELTQLAIATNREVVDLKYSITLKGNDYKTNWSLNVFCERKQKEAVANVIRPYLSPGVPFIKAKVNVPMSTD
ncbi:hypothetical protein [Pseudomonas extremaustralis]|uniref:Uncharacterized protein n=1 Tax=Pseudomonas extremaustralis TaxID=359110 RepID=A0A5C5PZR9_9PSED|nr:hypothetical protein [Pseudomonas extremaustralis]EZI25848.1 hypothetical protein PE143B_0123510 [Pseudomonas extremaustralis 14-3 substr. 14-3b]TWR95585.1 hypothetical protein FIV36_30895 [Pseudomonas extremaustralis]SDF74797.1 hypothetical protein SAMN05216591_3850 [Pseudomonas extremaustralis]